MPDVTLSHPYLSRFADRLENYAVWHYESGNHCKCQMNGWLIFISVRIKYCEAILSSETDHIHGDGVVFRFRAATRLDVHTLTLHAACVACVVLSECGVVSVCMFDHRIDHSRIQKCSFDRTQKIKTERNNNKIQQQLQKNHREPDWRPLVARTLHSPAAVLPRHTDTTPELVYLFIIIIFHLSKSLLITDRQRGNGDQNEHYNCSMAWNLVCCWKIDFNSIAKIIDRRCK